MRAPNLSAKNLSEASSPTAEPAFSIAGATEQLRVLTQSPRSIGSPGHKTSREYIVDQLKALGLVVEIQETVAANHFGGWIKAGRVRNIVARKKGWSSQGAILAAAHYDSVTNGFGAGDDGAGVVTLLESARQLARVNLKNDLLFLFTDLEEEGCVGATAFAFEHPWAKGVKVAFNFEARGSGGPSAMFETSANNSWLISEFAKSTSHPVANSFIAAMAKVLPNDTDFSIFKRAGFAGLNFAFADRLHHYHSFLDNAENLDPRSLAHHGDYALNLLEHFGNLDLPASMDTNSVYFDILGAVLVHYPTPVNFVLLALLIFAFLKLAIQKSYGDQKINHFPIALFGSFAFLGLQIAAILVSTAMMMILFQFLPGLLILAHAKVFFVAIFGVTTSLYFHFFLMISTKTRFKDFRFGVWATWLLLALVCSVYAPGMAYLFEWPLVLAMLIHLLDLKIDLQKNENLKSHQQVILVSRFSLTFLLCFFAANTTTTLLILDGGLTPAVPIAFYILFAGLIFNPILKKDIFSQSMSRVFFIGGLCLFLYGIGTFSYDEKSPKPNSVIYASDSTSGKSFWVSYSTKTDDWISQFFENFENTQTLPAFFLSGREVHVAPAPHWKIEAPTLQTLSENKGENSRTLEILIQSHRPTSCLVIWEDSGVNIENLTIDGKSPIPLLRFSAELDEKFWRFLTGDHSTTRFKMQFCGLDEKGLRMKLTLPLQQKLLLRITDESLGFPADALPAIKPRTSKMIPSQWSDLTMTAAAFEI